MILLSINPQKNTNKVRIAVHLEHEDKSPADAKETYEKLVSLEDASALVEDLTSWLRVT